MKKIKKLFKKLNNQGSSIVMVIVALAFIAIIVGALLTAVGYAYRLKLQDLNARDNFYYVEQAMNEIYAGVGSNVVEDMRDAYTYTIENMVVYDLTTKSYTTLSDDEVQEKFAKQFMLEVQNNALFSNSSGAAIGAELEKYITNETVKLDDSKLYLQTVLNGAGEVEKIIIKNVTLTRTVDYSRSVANGAYTQTITTDIEIGEPDFKVLFNADAASTPNIFGFAMVADMGVEISQPSTPLTITGNIYAAADYYNKKYNENTYKPNVSNVTYTGLKYDAETGEYVEEEGLIINSLYTHGSVTSKKLVSTEKPYSNKIYAEYMGDGGDYSFDGVNERSMYSGFFVEGGNVSVLADTVIVPGTVAIMDEATVSIYGKNGNAISQAELWADNVVLGGSFSKDYDEDKNIKYDGSTLLLRVDAFIKDDTELNASGSELMLVGGYYGYGDSTEKDERVFVPSVHSKKDEENGNTYFSNFQVEVVDDNGNPILDSNGKKTYENRGHYNSSAIIVNGEQSTLNLSGAKSIYLAGRSYIELSKKVTVSEKDNTTTSNSGANTTTDTENKENTTTTTDVPDYTVTETYEFVPKGDNLVSDNVADTVFIRDYKTGESISLKTNQVAYIPVAYNGMPKPKYDATGAFLGYWEAELPPALAKSALFTKYFPLKVYGKDVDGDKEIDKHFVPCIMQEISGKTYYYYDFETAYRHVDAYMLGKSDEDYKAFTTAYPSAQYYTSSFIVDYVKELKTEGSVIKTALKDITDFENLDFDGGTIQLPSDTSGATIYSSGAITTRSNTAFDIVGSSKWNATAVSDLLDGSSYKNNVPPVVTYASDGTKSYTYSNVDPVAYQYSNSLEKEYNYVKWNLGHYSSTDVYGQNKDIAEKAYIDAAISDANFGEASITPINKYLNMNVIADKDLNISPSTLKLKSGNKVWISSDTVTVTTDEEDGTVRGIIITKDDVIFDSTVKHFEGLIVSGGKIYVSSYKTGAEDAKKDVTPALQSMTASPAVCETIINECMTSSESEAKYVLMMFKDYAALADQTTSNNNNNNNDGKVDEEIKTIDSIDYSDVCRFNNWMKNVE